jgi:pentatricopeptide repeat protein
MPGIQISNIGRHRRHSGSITSGNPTGSNLELAALPPGTLQASTFSWNVRLARYVKTGQPAKTMEIFQKMQQEGMVPDKFIFVPVLNACASLQALEEGRCVHLQIMERVCESILYVANSLIDMYAKCGNIKDA